MFKRNSHPYSQLSTSYSLLPTPYSLLLASCLLLALLAASCAPADQPAPRILSAGAEGLEVGRYGKLELAVALEATYDNPYDVRQVDLTALFTGPDGREWVVPGFWDGDEVWRVRFTPSAEGEWRYTVQVRDRHGESRLYDGRFTCLPAVIAGWTQKLWQAQARPNLIGEFGTSDERLHPDLLHNGIWAGLAAGAAATPMEWNDPGNWGRMDAEMLEHVAHLASFVADLPLARLDPTPLQVTTGDEELEAWGLVGGGGDAGFFWVQDTAPGETRAGVAITVEGVPPGSYTVRPFDTWQGVYLDASRATADESGQLPVVLPPFSGDIAVRLER